jgi:hypothetical protein
MGNFVRMSMVAFGVAGFCSSVSLLRLNAAMQVIEPSLEKTKLSSGLLLQQWRTV